ncbi:hypothetical protein EPUL_003091 [Erysiphe pulchra]|uniref:Endonuclease/exonuclease/phosphatase domain-containing protein n=1 Tax=Erysiphe pulchra TaxID=225359 RepID=A0A2S4PW08_9PEZI|nr:hypothetical protein EPUL_003091 [Erysiphe pulchra]
MSGVKSLPATKWVSVIVPIVPAFIRALQGKVEINKTMLADENERVIAIQKKNPSNFANDVNAITPPKTAQEHHHMETASGRRKSHPFFDCHVLFTIDDARPRAITYTQKDSSQVNMSQNFLSQPTDVYCLVTIIGISFLCIYETPHCPSEVLTLLSWTPPPWSVIAGNFNSVHWVWKPGANHTEPTHRAGNALDLAWTNIGRTSAWLARDECMTSDHLPIFGSALCRDWVLIKNRGRDYHAHLCTIPAIGIKCDEQYQTPECKFASLNYQEVTSETERKIRAITYHAVVASSKRKSWKRQMEAMNFSWDVFKLMHWASPRQSKIPPPLIHQERIISDQAERATILRVFLLAILQSSDDLPPCTIPGEVHIPWKNEPTETEVGICTIGSGKTCSGADRISTELMTACWVAYDYLLPTYFKYVFDSVITLRV